MSGVDEGVLVTVCVILVSLPTSILVLDFLVVVLDACGVTLDCCAKGATESVYRVSEKAQLAADEYLAHKPWLDPAQEREQRIRLNGETQRLAEWMDQVRSSGVDHSRDQPWKIERWQTKRDIYVVFSSILFLAPKIILFALPMLVISFLCTSFASLHGIFSLEWGRSADRPYRHSVGFTVFISWLGNFSFLLLSPFIAASLVYDYCCYYAFGILYWIFRGIPSRKKSLEAIKPFRGGPPVWQHPTDILVCLLGQALRHPRHARSGYGQILCGRFEMALHFTTMVLIIPTVKYYWNANPWVYNLEQRFVQQITTSMQDLGPTTCWRTSQHIISRTKQPTFQRETIGDWRFVPHYPYPPDERRYSIGMQQGAKAFTLLVHTTHASSSAQGCTEQLLASTSATVPIYRVMLWYNNPYHFFTGYVEASLSDGGISQPDKKCSGEHPMWLVTAPSPFLSGRFSVTGTGMIDRFFDKWLPVFVDEMRRYNLGSEYAKAQHREVFSADGVSRPLSPGQGPADAPEPSENLTFLAGGTVEHDMQHARQELEQQMADVGHAAGELGHKLEEKVLSVQHKGHEVVHAAGKRAGSCAAAAAATAGQGEIATAEAVPVEIGEV